MSAPTEAGRAAHVISELLVSGERDWFESLDALRPVLPDPVWVELCGLLDLCPTHFCDIDICRDDEDDTCSAGRWAKTEREVREQTEGGAR
jgi:hypothetical protein